MSVRSPSGHRTAIARSSLDEVMFFSAPLQYKRPLLVEELTQGTQTSQWILYVWNNTVFKVERTMGSKKGKKESKKAAVRTSPRKKTVPTDADPDEDSQKPSQEPMDEPDRGDALPEGHEDRGSEGDGEKAEKVSTVFTTDQDEQIAAFFEEHTLFYDMSSAEYKNKKKRDNLLLELARSMFDSGKLAIS